MAAALFEWLREPEVVELRRSFASYLLDVLLPSRVPGAVIPQVVDLQEVKSMLAERVTDWTRQWKEQGLEEGRREGREEGRKQGQEDTLVQAREILLQDLVRRFGPLPEKVRRRIDAITSIRELTELTLRAGAATSLDALAK